MLSSQPETILVSADSVAEYDFLPEPATLVNSLFLADRGYFKLTYLDSIHQAGDYYAVRAKTTCNPLVMAC
ncbi:MAG: hypothetical protein ACI9J5_001790 [Paraglaciecola sp.]|jgi:hypothetical protein